MKAGPLSAPEPVPSRPTGSTPTVRPASGNGPQRVLLVDDSRSIRTLLKIYLMARSFEFLEAESAEEGLKVAEAEPVDLILTDFHMDGMNGADFAGQIRASANARLAKVSGNRLDRIGIDPKIPEFLPMWAKANGVDLLSADGRTPNVAEVRALGQKAGISAFVRKPVSCAQLMTLVDTILPLPRAAK